MQTLMIKTWFRWAELQLATFYRPDGSINNTDTVRNRLDDIEQANLASALTALDEVYAKVYELNADMNTDPEEDWRMTARAVKWMICAQYSLPIETLAEAASFRDDGSFNENVTKEYLLRMCSNFIVEDSSGIARFVHLSVQEYLQRRKIGETDEFSFDQAHTQVVVSCLTYLIHYQI